MKVVAHVVLLHEVGEATWLVERELVSDDDGRAADARVRAAPDGMEQRCFGVKPVGGGVLEPAEQPVQEAGRAVLGIPFPGRVEIDAELSSGCVFVTIRDFGDWRPPRGENRGRGLPLIEALMDSVDVVKGPRGTEVRLVRKLERRSGGAA